MNARRNPSSPDHDIVIGAITDRLDVTGPASTPVTIDDVVVDRHLTSTWRNEYDLSPMIKGRQILGNWYSLDGGIGAASAGGHVTRISSGMARIGYRTAWGDRFIPLDLTDQASGTVDVFSSFVMGSLAQYATDMMDSAIAAGDASAWPMFSDLAAGTRNPACWTTLAGWDLSCISTIPGSTLISPDIVYQVEHYPRGGATFVAMDGEIQARTITAALDISVPNSQDAFRSDIRIGKLSSALPEKFKPAQLPPANLIDYLPGLKWRVPTLSTQQDLRARVCDWIYLSRQIAQEAAPVDARRLSFYCGLRGGDSGSGNFLPPLLGPDSPPILLNGWTHGGAGNGAFTGSWLNEIGTAITTLGGTQFLEANLAAFPTY